jgi:hypothetical protein
MGLILGDTIHATLHVWRLALSNGLQRGKRLILFMQLCMSEHLQKPKISLTVEREVRVIRATSHQPSIREGTPRGLCACVNTKVNHLAKVHTNEPSERDIRVGQGQSGVGGAGS